MSRLRTRANLRQAQANSLRFRGVWTPDDVERLFTLREDEGLLLELSPVIRRCGE